MLFFGCSVEQTHKTLVFFFDGVDKVIFYADNLTHRDSLSKASEAKRMALLKKNRPDQYAHRPYKEKKCDACHTPDKRLIMPMPGLCFKCHQNFNEKYAVVHGPVASGGCLNCHNQHSSKFPKLLIREGQQICLYCHNSTLVFSDKVHRDIEDADCILCHSPHGGKARFMLKDNISKDANRIAQMDELTYRHLYGQIFCKVPGDINYILEIYILDSREVVVATVHPDSKGKFYLANLHPGQNYYFRFKKDVPDCKINIMDNNGTVLFEIDRDKKGRYVFERAAYETVHGAINDAHDYGDTLATGIFKDITITTNADQRVTKDTAVAMVETVETKNIVPAAEQTELISEKSSAGNAKPKDETVAVAGEQVAQKSKIAVKTLSDSEYTVANELIQARQKENSIIHSVENKAPDTTSYNGKIQVKTLSDAEYTKAVESVQAGKSAEAKDMSAGKNTAASDKSQEVTDKKSKIVVITMGENNNGEAPEMISSRKGWMAQREITRFEKKGVRLTDLSLQVAKFYDGTTACIVNEHGDIVDVAQVDTSGAFLFYDFLSYQVKLPPKKSGIISQTIFLNDDMEIIETINKRIANGRYVYVANSKEKAANKADVKIYSNEGNAILFSSVYFTDSETKISADGLLQLGKAVEYLAGNPDSKAILAAHSGLGKADKKHLSEKRTKAVLEYLIAKGVARRRIKETGKGSTKIYEITPQSADETKKNKVDVYIKDK